MHDETTLHKGRKAAPHNNFMKFSIVIPTHRRPDLLHRTLSSIERAERPTSLVEVVVVENGGRAGAEQVCRHFDPHLPITYLYAEQPGVGAARNVGASHCVGDMLLFFDDDIRLCDGTLIAYDAAFRQHGESAFYGGPLTPDYETPPEDWLIDFLPPSARGFSLGPEQVTIEEPCLLGGNFALPRSVFEHSEEFDAVGPTGSEKGGTGNEKRLQMRLMEQGWPGLFIPEALVGHFVPPERCSARFVRRRRWRRGYGFGELYASTGKTHKKFLGAPMWWWVALSGHLSRYAGSALALRPRSERFHHLLLSVEALGWIKGYHRQAR